MNFASFVCLVKETLNFRSKELLLFKLADHKRDKAPKSIQVKVVRKKFLLLFNVLEGRLTIEWLVH